MTRPPGGASPLAGRRIGLLTASASRLGGGVFEVVVAQAALLSGLGAVPLVFALEDSFGAQDERRFEGVPVVRLPVRGPRQIGYAPGLARALEAAGLDCLHLHGIWMAPSRDASRWARRSARPYLISPHGMLDPWILARGRLKKAVARFGYERASWRRATRLHALTEAEAADIVRATGRRDSLVIANAGPPAAAAPIRPRPPTIAYIGRIHPKKNLVALIDGWGRAALPADARLAIAGWGEEDDVAALRAAVAACPRRAEFLGPVYGEAKAALLAAARFVVLPSLSEGLPMAMLEAWAAATPTVMTAACHLPAGFATGAAIECGTSGEAIGAALAAALGESTPAWQARATAALALADGEFSARVIAARWEAAYADALAV